MTGARFRLGRLALVALAACAGRYGAAPRLELVETAPIETSLDHPDLAEAYAVWPAMIAAARERLELNEFYLSNEPGSRLEPVVRAVEDAARRGVQVRLLCDARFRKTYPETIERLAKAGVAARSFDAKKLFGGGVLHAKYFVVDGRDAFLGSQNFDWRSLEHIQELGLRTQAPAIVQGLRAIFEQDWALAGGEAAKAVPLPAGDGALVLAASPKDHLPSGVPWDLPLLVERISSARASVRVQLLTYKSGEFHELEDALVAAAARGVKVQLLLSNWELRRWTLEPLRRLDPRIEVRILTFPAASRGHIPFARVAHAKYMVVDGVHAWVGTSNWERDYFFASRNVGVFFEGPRLEAFFEDAWRSPYARPFDRTAHYDEPKTD